MAEEIKVLVDVGYDDDAEVPRGAHDFGYTMELTQKKWDDSETSFAMGLQSYAKAAEAIIAAGGRVGSVTVNPA